MDRLWSITSGGSLNHTVGLDMVDGPIVTGDAYIDYNGDSNREWRTVALTSMRRGGRGIVALDITQPDPTNGSPDFVPTVSDFPGCRDGGTGCQGEYPRLMWEFSDTSDDDANGQEDLGWTWSKPTIARIAVYNSSVTQQPNDVFVAFFGGGWDKNEVDQTGNFFYGVNLETGAVIVKEAMSVDLPGGVTALDSDVDGFHDRIYFADSDGGIWRLEYPAPTDSGATGAAAGTFTRIWDLRGLPDRQEFFTRPIPVPAISVGDNFIYALALGSGDRAELDREDSGIDHLYFVLDMGDSTTRDENDLVSVDYTDLDGSFDCTTNALNPSGGDYGWYLGLRDSEKTVNDAVVVNGYVFFATFDPATDTPTHNVPNECEPEGEETPVEIAALCQASGIGRTYKLWYECGLGEYHEYDDIITGLVPNNSSGTTTVDPSAAKPPPEGPPPPPLDTGQTRQHRITNWRQE
jgi:Tfp pilus tip-associated adhesin PilY1